MSNKTYTSFSTRQTPQTEPIPSGTPQVKNNAGGYVYALDDFKAMERFLVLGTEGGTYYVTEKAHTKQNALRTAAAINADGRRAVDLIVAVSDGGRAAKNDPALFALALAAAAPDPATRGYALAALPKVARIPTHLFHFITFVKQFRGMGRGLRNAIGKWYADQPVTDLAYNLVKYQQRDGWAHRDVFRQVHPRHLSDQRDAVIRWALGASAEARTVGKDVKRIYRKLESELPDIIQAFEQAKKATTAREVVDLIRDHNLSREMVPTQFLSNPDVWEALLLKMPPHALLRNLGNLSKCGLLKPLSDAAKLVVQKLSDGESLKRKRVHPIDVLVALKVYGQGRGMKGDGTWTVVPQVKDALDDAFYACFGHVQPTGKRIFYAVDCSGSMYGTGGGYGGYGFPNIANLPLCPMEGAVVMAMASARAEKEYMFGGFTTTFIDLGITSKMTLEQAMRQVMAKGGGGTDMSGPMVWALMNKINVDAFVVLTDNETYAGRIHPSQALRQYRERMGINSTQTVVGMTATGFTIADPADPRTLDVVGFDTATPAALSEFIRSY